MFYFILKKINFESFFCYWIIILKKILLWDEKTRDLWIKSNGKIVILDYFIFFFYGLNELIYHLIMMNWNHTSKWDLIFIEIIFYSIFILIKFFQTGERG